MALYQQHKFIFIPFCSCCILLVPGRSFGSYKRPVKAKGTKENVEITGRRPGSSLLIEHLYLAELAVSGVDVAENLGSTGQMFPLQS